MSARLLRLLRANPSLFVGGFIAGLMMLIAIFAPLIATHPVEQMDMANRFAGPSAQHWLGTDNFGRDLWSRLATGARLSLGVAVTSVAIAVVVGASVGLIAGYFGGWVDLVLMRIADVFLGFPALILALALVAALGPGAANVIAALAMAFWAEYARVVRATTLSLREMPYIEAARAIGAPHRRIIFREILPNAIGPVIVLATLGLGTAIIAESALSFLGFGTPPPAPTWGWTLAYGTRFLRAAPWLSTIAGLTIMIAVLGFNLLGDGLRDLLDPRELSRGADKRDAQAAAE